MRPLRRLRRADGLDDPVMPAVVTRAVLGPHAAADLERLDQLVDAHAGGGKVVAVCVVLVLLPTGPHPKLDATA